MYIYIYNKYNSPFKLGLTRGKRDRETRHFLTMGVSRARVNEVSQRSAGKVTPSTAFQCSAPSVKKSASTPNYQRILQPKALPGDENTQSGRRSTYTRLVHGDGFVCAAYIYVDI